jgi:hypothetical protein
MNKGILKNLIFLLSFVVLFSSASFAFAGSAFRDTGHAFSENLLIETNPTSFVKIEETGIKLFEGNTKSVSSSDSVNEKSKNDTYSKTSSKESSLEKDNDSVRLGDNRLAALSLAGTDGSFMPSSIWQWLLTIILILIIIIIIRILARRNSHK